MGPVGSPATVMSPVEQVGNPAGRCLFGEAGYKSGQELGMQDTREGCGA